MWRMKEGCGGQTGQFQGVQVGKWAVARPRTSALTPSGEKSMRKGLSGSKVLLRFLKGVAEGRRTPQVPSYLSAQRLLRPLFQGQHEHH